VNDTELASLAILEATPRILSELLGRLPENIVSANLDRDWSPRKILAHMVDVDHDAFGERIRRIVDEDGPALPSIDPLARIEAMGWEAKSTESLLAEIERQRDESCKWIRGLTDSQLQRTGTHDTAGKMTASNLLHYWAYHDLAHVRGIGRMVQAVLLHETAGISETMDV
jgi:uncharacterized damage-inducible protein DinB